MKRREIRQQKLLSNSNFIPTVREGENSGETSDRERGDILEQILNKGDIHGSLLKGPSGQFRLA